MKNEKLNKAIDGLNEELTKAKKMPIGTVSKGYKKVAEGKWVPVKNGKEKKQGAESNKEKDKNKLNNSSLKNKIKDELTKYSDFMNLVNNKIIEGNFYKEKDPRREKLVQLMENKEKEYSKLFPVIGLRSDFWEDEHFDINNFNF